MNIPTVQVDFSMALKRVLAERPKEKPRTNSPVNAESNNNTKSNTIINGNSPIGEENKKNGKVQEKPTPSQHAKGDLTQHNEIQPDESKQELKKYAKTTVDTDTKEKEKSLDLQEAAITNPTERTKKVIIKKKIHGLILNMILGLLVMYSMSQKTTL